MGVVTRCTLCTRRIWPWQRRGFLTGRFTTLYWHARCYAALVAES